MKLYDAINEGWRSSPGMVPPEYGYAMVALLDQAVRYKIVDIANYYWRHPDAVGGWALHDTEYFPSLRPPHKIVWAEYTMPKKVWLDKDDGPSYNPNHGSMVGALINALDAEVENFADFAQDAPLNTYWYIKAHIYLWGRNDLGIRSMGQVSAAVDEDGQMCWDDPDTPHTYVSFKETGSTESDDTLADALSQWAKPFFLLFSLLAADNVETVYHRPKARGKRKKRQFTPYHTLVVRPPKVKHRTVGQMADKEPKGGTPKTPHWRVYGYHGNGLLFGKHKKILYVGHRKDGPEREVRWQPLDLLMEEKQ